ncbi:tRNA (guanine(37)-N1)-methyltransferase [Basidiobolus ranarum]|uniref:tRNA (Guanine(37)-N1)-methyltransferase n=1 Tax=Basidiobolus ranarum TaxID=34480 RepID=A0ABR2VXD3_9FUNG
MFLPLPVRGVTCLNPADFERSVEVLAVKVPLKTVGTYRELFKNDLLSQPRMRNVVPIDGSQEFKLLLLEVEEESQGK